MLLLLGLLLLLLGIYVYRSSEQDSLVVNFGATYVVTAYANVFFFWTISFFIMGLVYFIFSAFKVQLVTLLTKLHVGTNIIGMLGTFYPFILELYKGKPYFHYSRTSSDYTFLSDPNFIVLISLLLVIFVQLLFLINIIIGIFRSLKS